MYLIKQSQNIINDFISLVIIMHMKINCKNHTAVTQVTNKARGPLVFLMGFNGPSKGLTIAKCAVEYKFVPL